MRSNSVRRLPTLVHLLQRHRFGLGAVVQVRRKSWKGKAAEQWAKVPKFGWASSKRTPTAELYAMEAREDEIDRQMDDESDEAEKAEEAELVALHYKEFEEDSLWGKRDSLARRVDRPFQPEDISSLSDYHLSLARGLPPDIKAEWQSSRQELRKRYGEYGAASGVDAGLSYPTSEELEERIVEEKAFAPNFFDSLAEARRLRENKENERLERQLTMEDNLEGYPKMLKEFQHKLASAKQTVDENEMKLQQKIKQIQGHFGFEMDPEDPRFQEMLVKIEKAEAKEKKARAKERRKQQMTQHLKLEETVVKKE